MAALHKVLLILPLLFLAVDAKGKKHKNKHKLGLSLEGYIPNPLSKVINHFHPNDGQNQDMPAEFDYDMPNPLSNGRNPFGININDGQNQDVPAKPYFDISNPSLPFGTIVNDGQNQDGPAKPDFDTAFLGSWELVNPDSGVNAMQINLLSNNKIIVFDTTIYRVSRLKLPPGTPCLPFEDAQKQPQLDCWAHAMEYDTVTNQVRPLKVTSDPWCSSGGVAPDGTLVNSGGFFGGTRVVRYIGTCPDCEWREYEDALNEDRWYATQVILPKGNFILVGGRRAFSYEFVPQEGQKSQKPFFFPFLYETSDLEENNLYPFVHLSTDGNLFIFSNNRSLLLNPNTNKIVRTLPIFPGGSRNYPASGMSALLPINLNNLANPEAIPAEVMVCGGNTPNAFYLAETQKLFLPALQDCGRMTITERSPKWDVEDMPSRRTMGDLLILPNSQLLFINGAQKGTAAWWDADDPNFNPVLYIPHKPKGERFKVLQNSLIARMYHSSSAVLPTGKIWVGGSNTHDTYKDMDKFPTETRIENFSPPYLDPALDMFRPEIIEASSANKLKYKQKFETLFTVPDPTPLTKDDIKVTMYFPPFTTHGFSMSQRQVVLASRKLSNKPGGIYKIQSAAPPSGVIAPPGFYMLFVVHRGVPSKAMWVHIGP